MKNPLVSIVLPTYNGSKYLERSIESCLKQDFTDFELIIVNDCSTDRTPQIIEEFAAKDSRIRVIHNSFNKKLPLSLNTGFDAARGNYFTWTSDDNFYAENALQIMVDVLAKDDRVDLVYTNYTLIDENDAITGTRTFGNIDESFIKWQGCGACFLYKKQVHQLNKGYKPEAFLIEDYDFFVRAYTQFHFHYLDRTDLYFYREHSASLTATQSSFINDVSKTFLERNIDGLEKKLPQHEINLLFRKFAVYYALEKNNPEKMSLYLARLRTGSLKQLFVTVGYIIVLKQWLAIKMIVAAKLAFVKLMFRK